MTTHQWMMIDGALNPGALGSLYADNAAIEAIGVLHGTPHKAIAQSGPILARFEDDDPLAVHWRNNAPPARHAWAFDCDLGLYALAAFWYRRLLPTGPMGQTLWLRYADARVMERGQRHHAMPRGFWQGITGVRLAADQPAWSPLPQEPRPAGAARDGDPGPEPFALDARQMAALAAGEASA
ncbi:DUF4123 domain-containing protein [Thioalkalivibrio sp. ALR17-21]|uniref:DUF4123 domain-containing protein n=1 Tax=Thioalkalivibrio sp. ALR17-21 TaxID=1269813 RepID=UPI0004145EB4|nr:DUF4123 domain-containing protein [Thioalkalivibrio sp. ALR17-21]